MEEKIKYDYSKLKGRIVENGLNNKKFAKAIGVSVAGLYNIFAGKSYFAQDKIDIAKEVLGIKDEEVVGFFFTKQVKKN